MTDSQINNTVLTAKQREFRTIRYTWECPSCGDDDFDSEESSVGEKIECTCGAKFEVIE